MFLIRVTYSSLIETFKYSRTPHRFMNYPYKKIRLSKNKVIDEHRHIMQQLLGRKLKRNEVVHHINSNKKDNRIENLEVQELKIHSRNFMIGRIPWNKGKKYNKWRFKDGKYWCNKCKKYLDKTKFFNNKGKKYGISDYCKKCHNI